MLLFILSAIVRSSSALKPGVKTVFITFVAPIDLACATNVLLNSRAADTRRADKSFSIPFIFSIRSLIRVGNSSLRAPLTICVSEFKSMCSFAKYLYASTPTSASTLLTPAPIDDSDKSFTTPNSPDLPT